MCRDLYKFMKYICTSGVPECLPRTSASMCGCGLVYKHISWHKWPWVMCIGVYCGIDSPGLYTQGYITGHK